VFSFINLFVIKILLKGTQLLTCERHNTVAWSCRESVGFVCQTETRMLQLLSLNVFHQMSVKARLTY